MTSRVSQHSFSYATTSKTPTVMSTSFVVPLAITVIRRLSFWNPLWMANLPGSWSLSHHRHKINRSALASDTLLKTFEADATHQPPY